MTVFRKKQPATAAETTGLSERIDSLATMISDQNKIVCKLIGQLGERMGAEISILRRELKEAQNTPSPVTSLPNTVLYPRSTEATSLHAELDHLRFRERELADIIREMDQKIWNIGQGLDRSPPPGFRELYAETARRKVDESNRMKDVLIPEMMKAYGRPNTAETKARFDEITKQQVSLPSPVDGKR